MHILLSSEETLYQVSTRTMLAKGRAEQVSAELFFKLKRSLPKKQFQEQTGYVSTAAQAAFASLNKLDWTKEKFCGEVNLTSNTETTISFDRDSSSAGLGYALALALEWRKQLNKSIDYDVEVFATGEIHASGAVTEIGHLETKISAACHFMEGKNATAQATQTPENQVKQPFVIFYPSANQEDITPELQIRVAALGGKLCPVERLQSALTILLGDAYDGDAGGRWEPFKGLLSFNYEDSLRFFGRERALTKLNQEFNEAEGLLVVTGVSGSGKSSLIKAGLIPQINQELPEGNTLDWLISTPKAHNSVESILFELLKTLNKHWSISNDTTDEKDTEINALANTAIQSPDSIINTIKKAQLSQPNQRVFYYVDQYEDIFNHQDISREQAQQLTPLLAQLTKQIPNLDIVISIRSEYEDILGKYGSVSHVNPDLNASEWGDIVYKQATSFGLRYEQALEKRIVDEASSIQHALPALEYLLEQLFEKAKKADENARVLTHEHYEQLKGIKGVIASRAEENIAKHPMQAHAFFEYFVGLNNENKPYAKSVNTEEIQQENEALYSLIQSFIDAQLVVGCSTNTEKRVKLAHDTLFNFDNHDSAWIALKEWFEENQAYLQWLNVISGDFKRWVGVNTAQKISTTDKKENPSSAFLLSEHDLSTGQKYQQENRIQQPRVREYITQSQRQKETLLKQKNKKQRLVTLLLSVFLLIAVGAGFVAYLKEQEARLLTKEAIIKKDESLIAQSKYLMDLAKGEFNKGEFDTALLLSLNALPGKYGGDRPDLIDYSILNDSIDALVSSDIEMVSVTSFDWYYDAILKLEPALERIYYSTQPTNKEYTLEFFDLKNRSISNIQVVFDSEIEQLETSHSGQLGVRTSNKLIFINPSANDEVLYEYDGKTEHFDFSKNGKFVAILQKEKLIVIDLELKRVITSHSIELYAKTVGFIGDSEHVVIRFPYALIRYSIFTKKSTKLSYFLHDGKTPDIDEFTFGEYQGFSINRARGIAFYLGKYDFSRRHKEAVIQPLSINETINNRENITNDSLVFSPSGKYMNLIRNNKIVIFKVHQDLIHTKFWEIPNYSGKKVSFSKFISDTTLIAGIGNAVYLWDVSEKKRKVIGNYKVPNGRKVVYAGLHESTNTLFTLADNGKLYIFKIKTKLEHHSKDKKYDEIFNQYKNVASGSFNFKFLDEKSNYGVESYDLTINDVIKPVHWIITNTKKQNNILNVTSNNNLSTVLISSKQDELTIVSQNLVDKNQKLEFSLANGEKGNWLIPAGKFAVIKYSLTQNKTISTYSFSRNLFASDKDSIKRWIVEGEYLFVNSNRLDNEGVEKKNFSIFNLDQKKLQCNLFDYDYMDIELIDPDYLWFDQALGFEKIDIHSCKRIYTIPKEPSAKHFLHRNGYHAFIHSGNIVMRSLANNEIIKEFRCEPKCQYTSFSEDGNYLVAITEVDNDFLTNYFLAWSLASFEQIMKHSIAGSHLDFYFTNDTDWKGDLIKLTSNTHLGGDLVTLSDQKILQTNSNGPVTEFEGYRVENRIDIEGGRLPIYHKVVDATLEHLPLKRKCLTPTERRRYHLRKLTQSEKTIRGCEGSIK